jgi:bilirubin oxidase
MVVNGRTWPYLEVEPRRYRFRILNGCNSRFLVLRVDDPLVQLWHIGNEAGYLPHAHRAREVLLGPAERADLIVDFSRMRPGSTATLRNRGPDAPFAGGGFKPADPGSTGLVMQFRVTSAPAGFHDPTTPPEDLVMPEVAPQPSALRTRALALVEEVPDPPGPDIPIAAKLGTFDLVAGLPDGVRALAWMDPVTENPAVGETEVWELYNFTEDAHPIHIHEVLFEVVDRQGLDRTTGRPRKASSPPPPQEQGLKDTVIAYPGQVTRVRMTFGQPGQFVWHCHIVEHEDNEMMRPYRIGPPQSGQPS